MLRSHTIPKQTYRVCITSGEPLREEATYMIRATNASKAFDRAGIDGLQFFSDDDEASGHTFVAYVRNRAGGPLHRFDGEFPTRRTSAVTNGRSQVGGRRRAGSSR